MSLARRIYLSSEDDEMRSRAIRMAFKEGGKIPKVVRGTRSTAERILTGCPNLGWHRTGSGFQGWGLGSGYISAHRVSDGFEGPLFYISK